MAALLAHSVSLQSTPCSDLIELHGRTRLCRRGQSPHAPEGLCRRLYLEVCLEKIIFYPRFAFDSVLAAAGLEAQTLSVDKPTLSFSAQLGGAPASQTLSLTSSSGNPTFFTFTNVSNPAWLTVSPISGNAPSTLTVTANPANLGPGTVQGTLNIVGPVNTVQVLVTFTIGSVSASPSSVSFAYQVGGTTPQSATVTLSSAQSISVNLSATTSSGGNWLVVSPSTGTVPGSAIVSVNSAILPSLSRGDLQRNGHHHSHLGKHDHPSQRGGNPDGNGSPTHHPEPCVDLAELPDRRQQQLRLAGI